MWAPPTADDGLRGSTLQVQFGAHTDRYKVRLMWIERVRQTDRQALTTYGVYDRNSSITELIWVLHKKTSRTPIKAACDYSVQSKVCGD